MGEISNHQVLGNSIKEDGKDSKSAMFSSLNKLSLFNNSSNTKKSEDYKNAFLNDLKKKMDTNNLDLEALDEVGQDLEDVLSEEISTPKDNDSDRIPHQFLEVEEKYRQINAEKIIGDQNAIYRISSRGENKSRSINGASQENKDTLSRFLTNQKSMISQHSHINLEGENNSGKYPNQKIGGKNLKT